MLLLTCPLSPPHCYLVSGVCWNGQPASRAGVVTGNHTLAWHWSVAWGKIFLCPPWVILAPGREGFKIFWENCRVGNKMDLAFHLGSYNWLWKHDSILCSQLSWPAMSSPCQENLHICLFLKMGFDWQLLWAPPGEACGCRTPYGPWHLTRAWWIVRRSLALDTQLRAWSLEDLESW